MAHKTPNGFTKFQLTVALAMLAILAVIVIFAATPYVGAEEKRNMQRTGDMHIIADTVYRWSLKNNGQLPTAITSTSTEICATGAPDCGGLIDLKDLVAEDGSGAPLKSIPRDPLCSTNCAANGTGYWIRKNSKNHITVNAPGAELGAEISITR